MGHSNYCEVDGTCDYCELKAELIKTKAKHARIIASWKKEEKEWHNTFDELRSEKETFLRELGDTQTKLNKANVILNTCPICENKHDCGCLCPGDKTVLENVAEGLRKEADRADELLDKANATIAELTSQLNHGDSHGMTDDEVNAMISEVEAEGELLKQRGELLTYYITAHTNWNFTLAMLTAARATIADQNETIDELDDNPKCTCLDLLSQIQRVGKTLEGSCEVHQWKIINIIDGLHPTDQDCKS